MASKCTICNENEAKYKCPKCRTGYCSVKCFKIHKTEPCVLPHTVDPLNQTTNQAKINNTSLKTLGPSTEADEEEEAIYRLSDQHLERLDDSARIKDLIQNPSLRSLMEMVAKDSKPLEAIYSFRQIPEFENFVQDLIETVDFEQPTHQKSQ